MIATTDVSGSLTAAQLYDAWGRPQATASLGNLGQYGYTGREPDETGMMFYRARYYDPSIGRFTQRDPIGLADGINRYAYVANDPVNLTDPSGEVGIIGGLIGGGAELLGQYVESRINGTTFVPDYGRVTVAAFAGAAGAGLVTAGNRLAQGASFLAKAGRVGVGVTVESASNIGQSLANGEQVTLGGIGLAAVLGGASARFGELAQTGFYASRGAQNVGSEADRLRRIAGSRIEDGLPRPGRVDARLNAARALDDSLDSSAKLRSEATASAIGFTEGVINRDPYINYFSNMLGTGGSGNQTLLGVSPRY